MAYSSSFLDIRNNNKHQQKITSADNSSSNYLDSEENLKFEEWEIKQYTITDLVQITNKNETSIIARRKKKNLIKLITEEEQESMNQKV
jgi:hypothetical protein